MKKTREGLQFPVREFRNWSVKDPEDQIALMTGNQARVALLVINQGKSLKTAIATGFSYPPSI